MAREYMCLYHSYLKSIEILNDAEKGRLFTACLTYSMTGEVPDLRGNERFLFPMIQQQIDRDNEKYRAKCEKQAQNASMRWHATACDGMPTDANDAKTKEKTKTKKKNPTDSNPLTPLERAIEDFKAHRKQLKKPMTDRAVHLLRNELEKLAPSDEAKQIAIIEQSIANGWQGVFELKTDARQTRRGAKNDYPQRAFNQSDLEGILLNLEEG